MAPKLNSLFVALLCFTLLLADDGFTGILIVGIAGPQTYDPAKPPGTTNVTLGLPQMQYGTGTNISTTAYFVKGERGMC